MILDSETVSPDSWVHVLFHSLPGTPVWTRQLSMAALAWNTTAWAGDDPTFEKALDPWNVFQRPIKTEQAKRRRVAKLREAYDRLVDLGWMRRVGDDYECAYPDGLTFEFDTSGECGLCDRGIL